MSDAFTLLWPPFLVATALVYELTLVTADVDILRARPCPVLPAA